MNEDFITKVLYGKEGFEGCRRMIQEGMNGIMINALKAAMQEEVEKLCGLKYKPAKESKYQRGGSTRGKVYLEGRMEPMDHPRVRGKDGKEKKLESYTEAADMGRAVEDMFRAVAAGVSSRDIRILHPGSTGFSSSTVNRYWMKHGLRYLEELRNRKIENPFVAVMIDGIVLSEDLTALVCLGIEEIGQKMMLDFEIGREENFELCNALLERLKNRNMKFGGGDPFFVLDGSAALDKAARKQYGERVRIQRCLVSAQLTPSSQG